VERLDEPGRITVAADRLEMIVLEDRDDGPAGPQGGSALPDDELGDRIARGRRGEAAGQALEPLDALCGRLGRSSSLLLCGIHLGVGDREGDP